MPNSQQNPPRCKSLLVEEALEYACNSNDAGFSRIRDEVLVHPDRVQVEWAIMDALLMKGFIHLAVDMTDTVRVVAWVDQHAQRLANNPGLLNILRGAHPFFAAGGAYGFAVLTWVHDPPFETPCSRSAVAV